MKRQARLALLLVVLAVGMLVAVADPVAADVEQDAFAAALPVFTTTGFVTFSGTAAATLVPVSIKYPA